MKIPHSVRIAVLVVGTTAFYGYVGQLVPQREVQPPVETVLKADMTTADVRWGTMPAISQYVLIFIAVTFTWLMGLMGYVRSGLRQHWHVYGVIRDTSADAFTPTLGFATQVVSVTVLIFFALIGFVFWLASLHDRPDFKREETS